MIRVTLPLPSRSLLQRRYQQHADVLEKALFEIQRRMRKVLFDHRLQPTIRFRVKSFESYYQKLLERGRQAEQQHESFVEITDLLGVRVVCPFTEDVLLVESLLAHEFVLIERERKGAEFSFKEFGYESMHYLSRFPADIVEGFHLPEQMVCEIQVRTILQDAWAEVEHELVYKSEFTPFDEPVRRKLAALNANLSLADMIFQEIRVYQRELHGQLQRRRESFWSMASGPPVAPLGLDTAERVSGAGGIGEGAVGPKVVNLLSSVQAETVDALLLHALYAHNEHRYQDAVVLYDRILEMDPHPHVRTVALIHRGMAHFGMAAYDAAVFDFTLAIDTGGDVLKAYLYRGMVQRTMNRLTDAVDDFAVCIERDPSQFEPRLCRAQTLATLGDYTQALGDCDAALALRPESADAQAFRDHILRKLSV